MPALLFVLQKSSGRTYAILAAMALSDSTVVTLTLGTKQVILVINVVLLTTQTFFATLTDKTFLVPVLPLYSCYLPSKPNGCFAFFAILSYFFTVAFLTYYILIYFIVFLSVELLLTNSTTEVILVPAPPLCLSVGTRKY
jgi:hypothetical protein